MKTALKTAFVASALGSVLAAAPLSASAEYCRSGMGYGKPGYHAGTGPRAYPLNPRMGYAHPGYYRHPVVSHGGAYGYSNYATPYGKPTNHRTGYHPTGINATETQATAPTDDIVDTAVGAGNFDTLVAAVKAAGLVETLKGEGPFTVFAPTDEAFAKVPADQLAALLSDKEALIQVLTYHVVPGAVSSSDVSKLDSAKTVQGESIEIDTSDGIKVDGATVVKADIRASNGVIHVIDTVIMPN